MKSDRTDIENNGARRAIPIFCPMYTAASLIKSRA